MNKLVDSIVREILYEGIEDETSCDCGCGSCSKELSKNTIIAPPDLISEGIDYHFKQNIPFIQNIYRPGSKNYFKLYNEVRMLCESGMLVLEGDDKELIEETDIGLWGEVDGKKVPLDFPIEEDNIYALILEDIAIFGNIYESVNIQNSYKIEDVDADSVSISFIFTDKHGIKRKLQRFTEGSIKLLWFNSQTQEWTTDDVPSKYEDEKVMNTFGKIIVKVILPKYNSFAFKALNMARYRLFRALMYNNLDTSNYEMDFNDETLEIEVYSIDPLNEEKKKPIGKPMRSSVGGKAYKVYVRDPKTKKIKTVRFGSGGLRAKINNPKARQAFAKRHRCGTGEPKTSARYWSCRLPRFSKLLGLKGSFSGFW